MQIKNPSEKVIETAINKLSEDNQIKLIKENIKYYRKIQNPTPKIVEAALKIDPEICYSDDPHLNKESTKAAYLILNNISKSSSEVIYNLTYYFHEVTDDIRILAINAEKFDDTSPYEVFSNIVGYINGKQDKPSEKVINCAFDKCCNYYIKISQNNDRALAGYLTTFYDYICKMNDLQDPNEKYLQKIFNIIQKNTSINFNAMSEYKLVKNTHDYKIFLDKFN